MKDTQPSRACFGVFELDLKSGELRAGDSKILLQEQPLQVLGMLLKREGELVTREEIKKKLWPNDTIVEFDHSINAAVKNLRRALSDSADEPKYVETVARRGYRVMVPVEWVSAEESSGANPTLSPKAGEKGGAPAEDSPGEGAQAAGGDGAAVRMQLQAAALTGGTVSHYRVLDIIGGGGMGVIYRAEDLKLGRAVALKFLPEEPGSEAQALERFSREARAASSIDHPNICSIYEFGEHEGRPFMVMQLLEGQTLRDRLAELAEGQKALPLPELLDIGIQVSGGLEAAHEKGIIHRDIKPANIFLTSKGMVKILDFGLAKLLESIEPEDNEQQIPPEDWKGRDFSRAVAKAPGYQDKAPRGAPLHSDTLTRTGLTMGTAGYMSPEQARGEKLDARTDVFSFGLVLYEMATGRRAYVGESAAVVREAILNDLPVPACKFNPTLPARLVDVIDRCLQKNREQRYQSASQLVIDLEEVRRLLAPPSSFLQRLKKTAVASIALFLVTTGLVSMWWRRRPLAGVAFQKYRMTALTSTGSVAFADISPDGRYLVYADDEIGKQSLWVKQLATSTTSRVLGPVSSYLGRGVRFTPDGSYLYYSQLEPDASRFTLYRLAFLGGTPQKILTDIRANDPSFSGAVDFSPDGKQFVFARYTGTENYLLVSNADGSDERRLIALPANEQLRVFAWAPDGRTIAFGIDEAGWSSANCVAVIPSSGGKERRILHHLDNIHGMAWLPDQSGLVITGLQSGTENYAVWILSYPDGSLRPVTSDLSDYFGVSLVHNASGLVTVQKWMDSSLWIATATNPSQATPLRVGASRRDGIWGVAWLGRDRLVYGTGESVSELWVMDSDGSGRRQLSHTNGEAAGPSAAISGGAIVFARWNDPDIWMIDSDGNNLRRITSGPTDKWNPEISPDGRWITYQTVEGPWRMPLNGGAAIRLDPNGSTPTISPDGRWIAFETWVAAAKLSRIKIVSSDGRSVRLLPFISEPQVPESANLGSLPLRWTAAGDAITYVRTQNGVSNIWSQSIDGSPARQLTNFTSMYIWRHAWSPDGKYLVMARGNSSRDAVMLTDLR
jgi:serine/threonine protein kinase/DNA-binding winged helix-turn-helix (wHTH) protein